MNVNGRKLATAADVLAHAGIPPQRPRPCIFSPCQKWRYTLWREWDVDMFVTPNAGKYLQVIGLNPSTADDVRNDNTVTRCIDFAKRWGFSGLCMTNIFAWRDTDPKKMKAAAEPIGAENDRYLLEIAAGAGMILAAWGAHGSHLGRADAVRQLLAGYEIHCLKRNADGSPMHPLYVASATVPIIL